MTRMGAKNPAKTFWGPQAAVLDLAGGAALQAVSKRPRHPRAGILIIVQCQ